MSRLAHRPDCNCSNCAIGRARPRALSALPRVDSGSRIIWGMGQDDDGSGDDGSGDDTSQDDSQPAPAPAPAPSPAPDDGSQEDQPSDDDSTEDSSGGGGSINLSSLLSTGTQALATGQQVSKAIQAASGSKSATALRATKAGAKSAATSGTSSTPILLSLVALGALVFVMKRKK
jgi:hypothetical protein